MKVSSTALLSSQTKMTKIERNFQEKLSTMKVQEAHLSMSWILNITNSRWTKIIMKGNMRITEDSLRKLSGRSRNWKISFRTVVNIIRMLNKTINSTPILVKKTIKVLHMLKIVRKYRSISCRKHTNRATNHPLIEESPCLRSIIVKSSPAEIPINSIEASVKVCPQTNRVKIFQIKEISQVLYRAAKS